MLLFQWALSQENWDEVFVNARVPRPSSIALAGGGELLEKDHQRSLMAVSHKCSLENCLMRALQCT